MAYIMSEGHDIMNAKRSLYRAYRRFEAMRFHQNAAPSETAHGTDPVRGQDPAPSNCLLYADADAL